ncbi:helix-turn-helix domain-containing protein [Pseudocnuella soli]|uniref:helix-turn-helix domain-containing protein n=1 Tax=Pseudocnuella soli TaxID=2502779 RepID=UPI001052161E|nr:AraC family transcriptional regulator [Pseudocnuella soli]
MNRRLLKHFFSLLHMDYVKLSDRWNYANVLSPYYRLYYIDEGYGSVTNKNQSIDLEPGYIYLIPSYTLCNLNCPKFISQYFVHFFEDTPQGLSLFYNNRQVLQAKASDLDIANIKRLLHINPGRGINRSDNPKAYERNDLYKSYQELNEMQLTGTFIETQGIILQLISRFTHSETFTQHANNTIPSKIQDAMSYIQVSLNKPLTVSKLAKRANQHQDHFSRLFLQYTGVRPMVYIHEKRIERAQYLIATTNMSLAAVASETGFETVPYFSKIFKKVTKLTPGQYKAQNQLS